MEEELAHLGGSGSTSSAPAPLSAVAAAAVFRQDYCPASTAASAALAYLQRPLSSSFSEEEELKVRIMSHPQYPALVTAYIDCQKVGAPPDVAARLSAVAGDLDASGSSRPLPAASSDPELDQFMEAYCDMLVKYREEITRILEDAMGFLKRAESQFNAIPDTASSMRLFVSSEENHGGVASPEDDQDASCGGNDLPGNDHAENEKELKLQLLKKYSGYLSSLRQHLSKKKKKGKLPKEARHKLLSWWELHYRWPYPSETEKAALAESTGLDQKQINNWFINQRKRHWKPSEEMQFVMMEGFHPQNLSSLYMEGRFNCDGPYRSGP